LAFHIHVSVLILAMLMLAVFIPALFTLAAVILAVLS
jgi:hypothetical protein